MKRIVSLILSLLMAVLSALGIVVPAKDGVTQGDWLAAVVSEFGIAQSDVDVPYADIPAEDLPVVQAAYGYGVITADDKIDVDAYATNAFVVKTINNASSVDVDIDIPANGRKAKLADAIAALNKAVEASNNQVVSAVPQSDIVPQADVADLTGVDFAADGDKLVFAAKDFKLGVGDKFIADAAYEVKAVEVADGVAIVDVAAVALEDAVKAIDFEGAVDADLDKAVAYDNEGNLIEAEDDLTVAGQGFIEGKDSLVQKGQDAIADFLKNPKVSFSVKGFKIKAAYSGGRVDLSVAGNVCDGVKVEKDYSLTNIKFDTKYDANLAKLQINEAYLKMNYDLVETTALEGSYSASVVPEGGSFSNEGATFLEKVKNNLSNLSLQQGGGVKVNIFTFDIPIGSTPLTVEMNVSLTLSANGRIELIVTSNETKGFEIINNKGRFIHASTVYDREFNITGDFRAVLGLDLSLTFLKIKIIDVEVAGGIGAHVETIVYNVKTKAAINSEIPLDVAIEASAGSDNFADLRFCADLELYGILEVSVGRNSILSKIGLYKTWTIFDRNVGNSTIAHLHIENSGIVDTCTYAA